MDAASPTAATAVIPALVADASLPWSAVTDASIDGALVTAGCPRPAQREFADATPCDFDGDGLRDWCSPRTPLLVAHARADRTCALADEAVLFRVRAHCPWAPRSIVHPVFNTDQLTETNELEAITTRAYCARIWGASAQATLRRARQEMATGALAIEAFGHRDGERITLELTDEQRAQVEAIATSAVFVGPFSASSVADGGSARSLIVSPSSAGSGPRDDGDEWTPPWRTATQDSDDAEPLPILERLPAATPAVRRECAQIEARAGRALSRAWRVLCRDLDGDECTQRVNLVDRSLARCYPARGGAWAFEATRATPDPDREQGFRVRVSLRWLGDDRSRAVTELASRFLLTPCDRDEFEVFGTSDYDGDNRGELVFRRRSNWCGDGDGSNDEPIEAMTVRDGHMAGFAFRSGSRVVRADRAEDVDGDGRLDLWNDGYYPRIGCDPAAVNGSTHPVFSVLLHSVAGGGFVYDDEVTQRAFRSRCESLRQDWAVVLPDDHGEHDRLDGAMFKERVVCARASGMSAGDVQRAVIRSLGSVNSQPLFMCNAIPVLSESIAVAPPFARPLTGALRWRP